MEVSCCHVFREMNSGPRERNACWIYFLKPVLIGLLSILIAGSTYLYCVPLTNLVGMNLFADFKCPNGSVWGACGFADARNNFDPNGSIIAVGFFVFLLTLVTIGLYILGIILYISSYRIGKVKEFRFDRCISGYIFCETHEDNWIRNSENQECCGCLSGEYQYYTSVICLALATLSSAVIIGTWVGRYIAVNTVESCLPYINTKIGLYGCISVSGNSTNQYVGGVACRNCAGIGFSIFGIPLILFFLFSMSIYFCIKRCKVQYKEIKDTYPDLYDLEPVKETNNGDILPNQCPICFLFMGEFKELSCCNKTLCKKCFNQVEICPFCRGNFNKNKPKIIKISL